MKTIHILLKSLFIGFISINTAQSQLTFEKVSGTSQSNEEAYHISQSPLGGYLLSGISKTNSVEHGRVVRLNNNGDTLWTKEININGGGACRFSIPLTDGFVIGGIAGNVNTGSGLGYLRKLDPSGNTVWTQTFGNGNTGFLNGTATSDGGFILSGATNVAFNGIDDFPSVSGNYLVKTNSSGVLQWEKTFDWSGIEFGFSVSEQVDGYSICGPTTSYSAGDFDGFILKTNFSGDSLWMRTYGGTEKDMFWSIQPTSDGGYVLGGETSSYGFTNGTTCIIKTNSLGVVSWTKNVGDQPWEINSIRQTADLGYIISGVTEYNGNSNGYLLKTDATGSQVWSKLIGYNNSVSLQLAEATSDGGYIIAGRQGNYQTDFYVAKMDLNACIYPVVNAGNDVTICTGGSTQFSPLEISSTQGISYAWTPASSLSCDSCINPVSQAATTTTYYLKSTNYLGCASTDSVRVIVSATAPALVSISGDTEICSGGSVMFSTQVTNGGGAPGFQWFKNGVPVGFNSASYSENSLSDQDLISCVLTTSLACASNSTANSNQLTVRVNPLLFPQFSVSSSDLNICDNEVVLLTATATDTGNSPQFVWKKISSPSEQNNEIIGSGQVFNPDLIQNGDSIYGVMMINEACANASYLLSDTLIFTVSQSPLVDAGADQTLCFGEQITLTASASGSFTWDHTVTDGQAFTPATTTTYTVTASAGNGCTATDQITVTVNALPTVNAGANQTICAGEQVTLSALGAVNYSWDNAVVNGQAFTPLASTTYTVTGTAGNGCTATDQLVVAVNALPLVDAGADQNICDGEQVTLNAGGAVSYSWDNGVIDGQAFTPTATMTYTVLGTDANGCSASDELTVFWNDCLGVQETDPDEFVVYPQPASGLVTFSAASLVRYSEISVIDYTGRVVYRAKLNEVSTLSIDLSGLERGNYRVEFSGEQTRGMKLVML